jgi:hypothetical protein
MADQNIILLLAAIVSFIPGIYFAWMILKGLFYALRGGRDDDL